MHLPHPNDGITLIQTLCGRYLVVAMSIDGSSRAPALQAGAADFLEKNGNPDDILAALRRSLSLPKTVDEEAVDPERHQHRKGSQAFDAD